jgi:hypothetical protein
MRCGGRDGAASQSRPVDLLSNAMFCNTFWKRADSVLPADQSDPARSERDGWLEYSAVQFSSALKFLEKMNETSFNYVGSVGPP